MAVEGNLEDISLTSLVQIICLEQRKGALVLKRRGEEGILFFENGKVVHATVGSLAGEEAAYQLLRWTDGTFRVSNHVTIPRRTITVPWGHLLLEGMRRIDEQKDRDTAQVQALSRAEIAQDGTLENDLILLLSKLEHLRAQLADKKSRKRPTLALPILTEMVNHILAFSEAWLDAKARTDSLTQALAEASNMYPAAQLAWIQPNQLSDRTVSKLYSDWPGNAASRRQAFHQTGQSMVYILEAYFSLFTARFRSSSAADRWREAFSIFVTDLAHVVDKIKF